MLDYRLATFLHVVECGSFSKAAEKLFISTVSIKKQMDSLESYVGVKLFERTNKGAVLTAAGKVFYEGVTRLDFQAQRILSNTRNAGAENRHTIRLGTSIIRPCKPLLDLWEHIDCKPAGIDFEIISFGDDTASVNELVSSLGKRIDCFIAPCDSENWHNNCNMLILKMLPLCLAFPKSHPLTQRKVLTWEDLEGESIILPPGDDSPIVRTLRTDIRYNHPGINISNYSTHFDISSFNKAVQSGCGIQTYSVWDEAHPALKRLPVDWDYVMPYGIVYAKNPSPATEQFIDVIAQNTTPISWEDAHK